MKLFNNLFTKSSKPSKADSRIFSQLFYGNRVTIDDPRDDQYIEDGYQLNPTVFSIVDTVTRNAMTVPWKIYKKMADGTKQEVSHPMIQSLLDKPNFKNSWSQVVRDAIGFRMLSGNSFVWGVNPDPDSLNSGKPQAIWVLPSQNMQIWQDNAFSGISHYSVDFAGGDGNGSIGIDADEVLHISAFNPEYDEDGSLLFGQSPLRAGYRTLLTANDSVLTGRSYLQNQGPQTLLTAQHGPDTPSFDAEQAKELKSQFRSQSQGARNAGGVLITPMEFNVLSTGMSAADLEMIAMYEVSKIDLCNVFGFPPLLLSAGDATFENQREAKLMLWEDVIIPHLAELRDGVNRQFISRFGKDLCIDFDLSSVNVLQERQLKQAEAVSQLQGIATLNEARAKLGLPKYNGPEGEQILVTNRFDQSANTGSDAS